MPLNQKKKTPKEIEKLIEIYSRAKQKILLTIKQKEAKGNSTFYQRSLLTQINGFLKELNKEVKVWSSRNIPKFYEEKLRELNEYVRDNDIPVIQTSFSKIHKPAIETIVNNLSSDLVEANNFVGRKINDKFKEIGLETTADKFAVGMGVKEQKNLIIEELLKNGIIGFTDKAGRNWQIDSYANMIANTTYAEAVNRATVNQLTAWDIDLVKVSENQSACPVCAVFEGRVFSISGKDKRFPALSVAYKGDNLNLHPFCKHSLLPYIPKLADNLKADMSFSNRSFNVDERSQKKIDLYNKVQSEKRELRNDKTLFQNFKLTLGDDAPKSLSAYKNIKNNNPEKFQSFKDFHTAKTTKKKDYLAEDIDYKTWYNNVKDIDWKPVNFAPGKLEYKLNTVHSEDYSGWTKEEYLGKAKELLSSEPDNKSDIFGFKDEEGWRYRYDKKNNDISFAKPDGTIDTMYKPTDKTAYWNRQVDKFGGPEDAKFKEKSSE